MNVADSQRVGSELERLGYEQTAKPEEADVIVLNTCVVRQSAEDKALGRLSSLKPLKKHNPDLVINVMGCLIGYRGNEMFAKKYPFVDVFSPPSDPAPLVTYLTSRSPVAVTTATLEGLDRLDQDLLLPQSQVGELVSAYVPVVLGCSHACAYCIIPSKRGVEESRDPEVIVAEAQSLVAQGVKEITLLGQIVDRYGKDNPAYPNLANLMTRLTEIDGLLRLRFLTSHPNWMTDELLETVASNPKIMPHIEVPAQAGDDQVLAAMRRGYTAAEYTALIEKIRRIIPDASIGTDIIVGFPGESEAQFENTFNMLAALRMDVAHLARYSPRPGTLSALSMPDNVTEDDKWQRFRRLEELQETISTEILARHLGKMVPVLFEEKRKARWKGRTPQNKLVFVESGDNLMGQELPVRITWTGPWSMIGELSHA